MAKKMNKIEKLIDKLCPDGVEFKEINAITKDKFWIMPATPKFNASEKIPYITSKNIRGGHIDFTKVKYISRSDYLNLSRNRPILEGDILISMIGTIGEVARVKKTDLDFYGQNMYLIRLDEKLLNSGYFLHYFDSKGMKEHFNTVKNKSSQGYLKARDIETLKIPIPPLAIQKEIVKILDNFTKLEAELEAELEARKKQYEYYRDELLSIKNVEYKTLGEIGILIRGNGLQKKDFRETGVGCIHYGQIYTYYGTFASKTKSFVSQESARKFKKAQKGDVLVSGVSENVEDICKPLGWLGDEICISGDMFSFRHNQNTKFITYILQTTNFQRYKKRFAQGTKVIRVKKDKILDFKIPIPPIAEQKRIVAILDKFDALVNDISTGLPAELEARRKQYEYYREKLLTFKPLEKQNVN
ncbi:MAG: restriction endonuclease subunit S [Candidatus Omnitrophota bacterium]